MPCSMIVRASFADGLFLEDLPEFFGESGDNLEDVADYAVCGDFEDGRIRVFVDREDDFR